MPIQDQLSRAVWLFAFTSLLQYYSCWRHLAHTIERSKNAGWNLRRCASENKCEKYLFSFFAVPREKNREGGPPKLRPGVTNSTYGTYRPTYRIISRSPLARLRDQPTVVKKKSRRGNITTIFDALTGLWAGTVASQPYCMLVNRSIRYPSVTSHVHWRALLLQLLLLTLRVVNVKQSSHVAMQSTPNSHAEQTELYKDVWIGGSISSRDRSHDGQWRRYRAKGRRRKRRCFVPSERRPPEWSGRRWSSWSWLLVYSVRAALQGTAYATHRNARCKRTLLIVIDHNHYLRYTACEIATVGVQICWATCGMTLCGLRLHWAFFGRSYCYWRRTFFQFISVSFCPYTGTAWPFSTLTGVPWPGSFFTYVHVNENLCRQ